MKSRLCKLVPALLLLCLLGSPACAQSRVATVDLRKLFDGYWKTKQADSAIKDRAADLEKERKTMLEEWKKARDDYQTFLSEANNQTLSLEEREKRKKSAEDKLKQIKDAEDSVNQYDRQARSILDEQRKRMRDTIVDEIRSTVKGKATAGGFALVVDTSADTSTGTPVVLFSNNEHDLTDAVLAQLNAAAPPDTAKPDQKAPAKQDEKKKDKK
jgi:outer membrane protein